MSKDLDCDWLREEKLKENKINYISKNDLAKSLGVSLSTISRKLTELQGIKLGNARQSRVLFKVDKVNDYLEGLLLAKKKRAD